MFTSIIVLSCKEKESQPIIKRENTTTVDNTSKMVDTFESKITPIQQDIPSSSRDSVNVRITAENTKVEANSSIITQPESEKPDYSVYEELLRNHVSDKGLVNYKRLLEKKKTLDDFLIYLGDFQLTNDWSKNEQLAYWINLYNAVTIQLILENYPVTSIMKLENGKPFVVKRISVNGRMLSLNEIENEIIRPTFRDPRVHFALNCAAKSCPPLYNGAFTPKSLDVQLNKQTLAFLHSGENSFTSNEIRISRIFDWYKVDFGNIHDFLRLYGIDEINDSLKITYTEYDWSLNE